MNQSHLLAGLPGLEPPSLEGGVMKKEEVKAKRQPPHHGLKRAMQACYESLEARKEATPKEIGRDIKKLGFKPSTAGSCMPRMAHTGHAIRVAKGVYVIGKAPPQDLRRW